VGGVSTLFVAIEGDAAAADRFAAAFATAARAQLADDVLWVDDTVQPVREFYERQALLYLPLGDLNLIDEALDRAHRRLNPLFASLDGDKASDADLAARVRRLREARKTGRFPRDRYVSADGSLTVVTLRPRGSATGVEGARRLLARTRALADGLHPEAKGLRVSLAGSTATSVEEYDTLRRDIVGTAALCAVLVFLAVWLFLRRLRCVLLLAVPLAFGSLYAFAAARVAVGYVNAQTAFLGALIVGTGVNYGVMLCARYLEELSHGAAREAALATAVHATFRPTLAAATATAVSFAALGVAQIPELLPVRLHRLGGHPRLLGPLLHAAARPPRPDRARRPHAPALAPRARLAPGPRLPAGAGAPGADPAARGRRDRHPGRAPLRRRRGAVPPNSLEYDLRNLRTAPARRARLRVSACASRRCSNGRSARRSWRCATARRRGGCARSSTRGSSARGRGRRSRSASRSGRSSPPTRSRSWRSSRTSGQGEAAPARQARRGGSRGAGRPRGPARRPAPGPRRPPRRAVATLPRA